MRLCNIVQLFLWLTLMLLDVFKREKLCQNLKTCFIEYFSFYNIRSYRFINNLAPEMSHFNINIIKDKFKQ